ncbi:MAG: three component ABC system middle component [Fimbriimonadales bacterium]
MRNVQNPALGALLIWRFACAYREAHQTKDAAPITLAYLVLPLLLHEQSQSAVRSTLAASGLRAAIAKFSESKNPRQDLLIALHNRALRLRALTTSSLGIAVAKSLVSLDAQARITALSTTPARATLSADVQKLATDSEKFGRWCAELSLHEVSAALKVRF